jgi:hypothetical protein
MKLCERTVQMLEWAMRASLIEIVAMASPMWLSPPSAIAGPAFEVSSRCKALLAADFRPLGKGADIVRRLHPRFEEKSFVVPGEPALPLVDCDLLKRPAPATGVAVLLTFPTEWNARGETEGPTKNSWQDDQFRFELAVVSMDEAGKPAIVRNDDVFPHHSLEQDDSEPLPLSGEMRLDRTVFRLDENELALGVHFGSRDGCMGVNTILREHENLALFRVSVSGVARVLLLSLKETWTPVHCEEDEDCGTASESKYIVKISKHKTSGLFDMVHKDVSAGHRGQPVVYQWDGSQYQPSPRAKR